MNTFPFFQQSSNLPSVDTGLNNITFILGGARSGKSTLAEALAKECGSNVIYCATAEILDEEMKDRVKRHQERRPQTWRTVEAPRRASEKLSAAMSEKPADCVLFDCLSVLCSNVLLNLYENIGEAAAYEAFRQRELDNLIRLIEKYHETRWIIVSNEVGMGVVPAYKLGRTYRDMLGRANQKMASLASEVIFMVAGIPLRIK